MQSSSGHRRHPKMTDPRLNSQCFVVISEADALRARQRFDADQLKEKARSHSFYFSEDVWLSKKDLELWLKLTAADEQQQQQQQEAEQQGQQEEQRAQGLALPPAIEWNMSNMLAYEKEMNSIDDFDFTLDMTLAMLCDSIDK